MTTKDTLATLTPAAEAVEVPAAPSPPAPKSSDSGGLRADAVSLEVPVRVHGSHVTEATKDAPARTEPFEEATSTMIIFPQGAVLRMASTVAVGQMIVVTNLKSGQDAICRIVKVRAYGPNQSYVETEFTHRQVGYWGVQFSSDPQPASPVPSVKLEAREKSVATSRPRPTQESSAIPPERVPSSGKPPVQGIEDRVRASATPASEPRAASPAAPTSSPLVEELSGGDAFSAVAEGAKAAESGKLGSTFGSFGSSNSLTGGGAAREMFGARSSDEAAEPSAVGGNKLLLIGAAAIVLVLAGGGYFLFQKHTTPTPAVSASASPLANSAPSPASAAVAPAPVAASVATKKTSASSASVASVQAQSPSTSEAATSRPVEPSGQGAATVAPEAPHHPSGAVPSLFGAMNAHPVAPRSKAQPAEAAPELDANAIESAPAGSLPGVSAQGSLLAPKFSSTPPRLISSVAPEYPLMAKQRGVQGAVVVSAMIEPNGTVGQTRVVSGPQLLRDAALDAVRRWKYDPGRVDGQAAEVEIDVTVNFVAK